MGDYRIRRARTKRDWEEMKALDHRCFPPPWDDPPTWKRYLWWVTVDRTGKVVAYAAGRVNSEGLFYLARAGTAPEHRGKHLQQGLIRARVAYAKRIGVPAVVTYTLHHNHKSANNLIRCGFRLYDPATSYGEIDSNYWWLPVKRTKAS